MSNKLKALKETGGQLIGGILIFGVGTLIYIPIIKLAESYPAQFFGTTFSLAILFVIATLYEENLEKIDKEEKK